MITALAEYRTHATVDEIKATEKAQIQQHKLTGNVRNVYGRIVGASFGNLGACTLKSQTIADALGIAKSTVTRCIKKLKDLHVIEVINSQKGNGIKGANIYAVIFLTHNEPSNEPTEMSQRETHETLTESKDEHTKIESESLSFNLGSNLSVVKNVVNNVAAPADSEDLKQLLRDAYKPKTQEQERDFIEMCKIAFGRLKQFMKLYNLPYLQIKYIIIRCMHQLVKKNDVNNPFAMYSRMIKRQVEQLFEEWVKPVKTNVESLESKSKEYIPEWFGNRNNERNKSAQLMPSTVDTGAVDFEAERQKILAKLGG